MNARIVVLLSVLSATGAEAQPDQREPLAAIADFADRMCPVPAAKGQTTVVGVEGGIRAELAKLIKKLVDLGISGAAKYQTTEYAGVLQTDLAPLFKDAIKCRLQVWNDLKGKFAVGASSPTPTTAPFITGGSTQLAARTDRDAPSGCRSLADSYNNPAAITFVVQNAKPGMSGRIVSEGRVEGLGAIRWVVDGAPILLNNVQMVNRSSIFIELDGAPPRTLLANWPAPDPRRCQDHELHIRGIQVRFVSTS